jgi:hypothetical protein
MGGVLGNAPERPSMITAMAFKRPERILGTAVVEFAGVGFALGNQIRQGVELEARYVITTFCTGSPTLSPPLNLRFSTRS